MGKERGCYSSGCHKCNTVFNFHPSYLYCLVQNEKGNLSSCKETKQYRVSQYKVWLVIFQIMFYIWLYMLLSCEKKKKKTEREINQSRKQKRAMGNRWMMTFKEWHEKLKKCYTKPGNCHFAAMAFICDRLQCCFTAFTNEGHTDVTMRNSQFESSSTASNGKTLIDSRALWIRLFPYPGSFWLRIWNHCFSF